MRLRPRAAAIKRRTSLAPDQLTGVLLRGLRDALRGAPIKASARKRLLGLGLIEKCPDRFSKLTPRGLDTLRSAQAIEARRAETHSGSVHESAVPKECAQTQDGDNP